MAELHMNLSYVYGKDFTECKDFMELLTWKAANWTLEDMGIHGRYQLTDDQPHKPVNLPPAKAQLYDVIYRENFYHLCDVAKADYETQGIATAGSA